MLKHFIKPMKYEIFFKYIRVKEITKSSPIAINYKERILV